jgi:hypothetical protein
MEKQSRRNIKRWKDNCSTDDVRKNKSSFEYVKGSEILALLPLKRCGQTQKLQDLVVPKEMTLQILYMQNRICLRRRK